MFDKAIQKYPDAKPIFYSDRGFQYTGKTFKTIEELRERIIEYIKFIMKKGYKKD